VATGAELRRAELRSKLTVLSAIFGRRVIRLLSDSSEIRLSSLTNDSPHQALETVSQYFVERGSFAYLVYLRIYLLSFW
jgi:hypothetical protein